MNITLEDGISLGKCFVCDAELPFDQLKQRIVFTARDRDLSSFWLFGEAHTAKCVRRKNQYHKIPVN